MTESIYMKMQPQLLKTIHFLIIEENLLRIQTKLAAMGWWLIKATTPSFVTIHFQEIIRELHASQMAPTQQFQGTRLALGQMKMMKTFKIAHDRLKLQTKPVKPAPHNGL